MRAARAVEAMKGFFAAIKFCQGEDGYAFVRRLRSVERGRGRRIPIAALTALASEEDRRKALDAGFQAHLTKPIDAERLVAAIEALSVWEPPEGEANRPN